MYRRHGQDLPGSPEQFFHTFHQQAGIRKAEGRRKSHQAFQRHGPHDAGHLPQ
jgi:hypothetical protein